jgi:predicted RNase H-like nuclease
VDGCRGGWIVTLADVTAGRVVSIERVDRLDDLLARVDTGAVGAVAIDIPIGLPAAGPRSCDIAARRRLGPRRSSVFPAPARPLLGAVSWPEALALSRRVTGTGLSRQSFNLLPKIAEVDALMTPDRQARVVEASPELSFACLAGAPMPSYKKTAAGRLERLAALAVAFPDLDGDDAVRSGGDDALDAVVLAWTADRWRRGVAVRLGDEVDATGLRMEVVA